jgi:hypothetical protein
MLYQACHWLNNVYPLTVFFLYVGLFVLAFCLAFLIPAAAILILIGSIFALLPFVFANHLFQASERILARRSLRRGLCPACSGDIAEIDGGERNCPACHRVFDETGTSELMTN